MKNLYKEVYKESPEEFGSYMSDVHMHERPMVLDDDLPDDFANWEANLSDEELNKHARNFLDIINSLGEQDDIQENTDSLEEKLEALNNLQR